MRARALYGRRRVKFLPMTSTATPVSAATEQQHDHNDNQNQFHGNSPLMAMALFAAYQSIQQRLQSIVPDKRSTPQLALRECEQFRSVFAFPPNRVPDLAAQAGLPSISFEPSFAQASGLVALARLGAHYVDKILKGAKPAELPIEQPTKYLLVINLRTAKSLGTEIPRPFSPAPTR
jgi:hypothetical protein